MTGRKNTLQRTPSPKDWNAWIFYDIYFKRASCKKIDHSRCKSRQLIV